MLSTGSQVDIGLGIFCLPMEIADVGVWGEIQMQTLLSTMKKTVLVLSRLRFGT